jgi:N-acyl-D-amino-acid deacylase
VSIQRSMGRSMGGPAEPGPGLPCEAIVVIDAEGLVLAPGFIDTHTHDDLAVIHAAAMLPKISQGVTTVIIGNCGISAAPVLASNLLPDPTQLLGPEEEFVYASFADYVQALKKAQPAVNVAALVGHTSLRANHLDRLDRAATETEVQAMRAELQESLDAGALGLSTGLAYLSALDADTYELLALTEPLRAARGLYATHLRTETAAILDALEEAFGMGAAHGIPVVISHLKCAGVDNWGRSEKVLACVDEARTRQAVAWDCYPYAAGSSTLDLRQVDERVTIQITWSDPHPEVAGQSLAAIAQRWNAPLLEAARRLQPAGAIYHSIDEQDMQRILAHPGTMIGSDGLPRDPRPHPRLWGTFPRVLGRYCRELALFPLEEAVRKMTSLPAARFGLAKRGLLQEGYFADLVLFDPATIEDMATYKNPTEKARGIHSVWVNGVLSFTAEQQIAARAGRFLPRSPAQIPF